MYKRRDCGTVGELLGGVLGLILDIMSERPNIGVQSGGAGDRKRHLQTKTDTRCRSDGSSSVQETITVEIEVVHCNVGQVGRSPVARRSSLTAAPLIIDAEVIDDVPDDPADALTR